MSNVMGFRAFYKERVKQAGCSLAEFREAYPVEVIKQEWEAYLWECASKDLPFTRQLLSTLTPAMQAGIHRHSRGKSFPAGYVIKTEIGTFGLL